jgi:hypothetical protein
VTPVVVVVGVTAGCGVTTVAWGLAAALSARDPAGTAVVTGVPRRTSLASAGARRLARALRPLVAGDVGAAGRVCVVASEDPLHVAEAARGLAPVVLDAGLAADAGAAVSLGDHVVLVAPGRVEPALPAVVARSLSRFGPAPVCAVSRADPEPWSERDVIVLPDSRFAARRARKGAVVRGALGEALEELAARCEGLAG